VIYIYTDGMLLSFKAMLVLHWPLRDIGCFFVYYFASFFSFFFFHLV
jgi:hypothetical protein